MTKLSDTQLVVLAAACQRPDRNLLPLPAHLKGGAQGKVVASLIGKGLVEEAAAGPGEPVWREAEDGSRTTLRATDAAFQALGIEKEDGGASQDDAGGAPIDGSGAVHTTADQQADTPAAAATGGDGADAETGEPDPADSAPTSPVACRVRKSRPDTKQAQLVAMLQRPDGASLDEIVAATGWQAHTVRGAVAGALKKKLGLTVTSEKVEGRGRVYRT